jgi:hypothetical protein
MIFNEIRLTSSHEDFTSVFCAQKSPNSMVGGRGKGGGWIRETDFPSASPQFPQVNLVLAFEDEDFISYSLPHRPTSSPPPPSQPGIGSDVRCEGSNAGFGNMSYRCGKDQRGFGKQITFGCLCWSDKQISWNTFSRIFSLCELVDFLT